MTTRPPAVAGRFYDGEARRLRSRVDAWLAADNSRSSAIRGLIVPHAGYDYSGPVAAAAYRTLDPAGFDRIVSIGPAHFVPLAAIAASSATAWHTPLGDVPLDTTTVDDLVATGRVLVDDAAHEPEHSLEVQLPFLQVALPGAALVPLLVGHVPAAAVADVLDLCLGERTLFVVSTDLSHYHPYGRARALDERTARRIVDLDPDGISDRDACGAYALRGALTWARRQGLTVRLLDLRNSGDTSGTRQRVVGYGSFALTVAS